MREVEPLWFQKERAEIISSNQHLMDLIMCLVRFCTCDRAGDENVTWLHVLQPMDLTKTGDDDDDVLDAWATDAKQKRLEARTAAKMEKLDRELQELEKKLDALHKKQA